MRKRQTLHFDLNKLTRKEHIMLPSSAYEKYILLRIFKKMGVPLGQDWL